MNLTKTMLKIVELQTQVLFLQMQLADAKGEEIAAVKYAEHHAEMRKIERYLEERAER